MKKLFLVLISLILSFPAYAADPKESAYDRVIRTGTLRCGYIPYSYFMTVDPNTGAKSGVNYDIVNEIGRLLQLKVEWAEELTWATVATTLQAGRVDAFCSGMWIDAQNGKFLAFAQPLYFNAISAYGRADETRFKTPADLNDPKVRIVSRDGGTPGIIARQDFPEATLISLPGGVSDGEMIEQLNTGKADVILYGDDYMRDIMQKQPGKFRPLFGETRLRVYATAIGLPIADPALKNMFDNAVTELKSSRFVTKTLARYAPPDSWLTAQPQ